MAVYRERKHIHPVLLVCLGVVAAIILVLIGFLIFPRAAAPTDPLAQARSQAREAAQGLEVFTIEYPQAAQGAELSGAIGALARAQKTFETAQADLARIDAAKVDRIAADFVLLKEKVDAHAPAAEVVPLADEARQMLLALVKAP
jgi:hypothetical protein